MRILISAFACAPSGGSEGGVGWHWANALAAGGHDVTVLTDTTRRAAILEELERLPAVRPSFVFHRPAPLRGIRLSAKSAQLLYSLWQYGLLPEARRLHAERRFELVIHLTYGVFRHPSFLGWLGVPFVFGPVGGGEDAPWALKRALPPKEKLKEAVRTLLNLSARLNPAMYLALSKADLILAKTQETIDALPRRFRAKAHVHVEIGVDVANAPPAGAGAADDPRPADARARSDDEPFEVLYAGRLLGWKGIDLALEAFARLRRTRPGAHLTLVGSGPLSGWIAASIDALGLRDGVSTIPHLPQHELFRRYADAHCLLFPSLHDSSGNVVLEAQGHGLPVVCLDRGGPATLVSDATAFAIDTRAVSRDVVIERLSIALARLYDDDGLRATMSGAAHRHAAAWTWQSRACGAVRLAVEVGVVDADAVTSAPA